MTTFPTSPRRAAATLALALAAALAQAQGTPNPAPPAAPAAPAAPVVDMAQGEVRRIDRATARLTLRHGDIASLGMPPMTMVFNVTDKALLDPVKVGDKVRFQATSEGGKFIVTALDVIR